MPFSWQYVLPFLADCLNLMAQVSEVGMTKTIQSVFWCAKNFGGDDNNAKCGCVTGKLGVASVTMAILFDVIKDQLLILSGNFYLCNLYFVYPLQCGVYCVGMYTEEC